MTHETGGLLTPFGETGPLKIVFNNIYRLCLKKEEEEGSLEDTRCQPGRMNL